MYNLVKMVQILTRGEIYSTFIFIFIEFYLDLAQIRWAFFSPCVSFYTVRAAICLKDRSPLSADLTVDRLVLMIYFNSEGLMCARLRRLPRNSA